MDPYVLGIDVWEGALDIDEDVLFDAGVRFIVIRLNNMAGGHHMDKNFWNQWEQAKRFIRWPYFVYNPWVSGEQNFYYLRDHMPPGCNHISLDIEVRYPDYSPSVYAYHVRKFVDMVKQRWTCDIYTGQWFLSYLSSWPADVPYWWARYPRWPEDFYPPQRVNIPWEEIYRRVKATPWDPGPTPGPCRSWQISGDRFVAPGCANRPMDINVFHGTLSDLEIYTGQILFNPVKPHAIFMPMVTNVQGGGGDQEP